MATFSWDVKRLRVFLDMGKPPLESVAYSSRRFVPFQLKQNSTTMRPRIADTLKEMGYSGDVTEFRRALAEVKAESYPEFTDEELIYTRDEAGTFCAQVRKRLGAPRLT